MAGGSLARQHENKISGKRSRPWQPPEKMSPCDKSVLKVTTYSGLGSSISIVYNPLYPGNAWFGRKTQHLVQNLCGKLRTAIFRVYRDGTGKPCIPVDPPLLSAWRPMYAGGVESWPGRCQSLSGLPPPHNKWWDQSRPGQYHTCYPELVKTEFSKYLQRFEEFVDNTIEEDCFFQCPRGKQIKVWWL